MIYFAVRYALKLLAISEHFDVDGAMRLGRI
jgi:hypothetical protein